MSIIPANLARVPDMLTTQISRQSLLRTNQSLLQSQIELASGRKVSRPSDDAIASGTIAVLDDIIERRDQRLRNLSHADSVLNTIDAALADANELLLEAKGIGASQIGVGSDADTRANEALVIEALLGELVNIANRQQHGLHFFGGNATASQPVESLLGGYRYIGEGDGLVTELGLASSAPITISAEKAFGSLSTRVQGERDLDPDLTGTTRLQDLSGARGFGVALGSINADVNGTDVEIDLTGVHTVQDVIDTVQTAIQTVDAGATVAIAASGDGLEITPTLGPITISDLGADATAADLGLAATFPLGGASGGDLDPRITLGTPIADLPGVTVPLGTVRVSNLGQVRDVDLSTASQVEDIVNAIEGLGIGIRVEIAESGDRLDFVNELSGGAMSVAEVAGGSTATQLGVRSLTGSTRLADFNDGRGVQILSGASDPVTGLLDPTRDIDFEVTLKDGQAFSVDLAGAETVQDVLDAVNAAAGTAGVGVPGQFQAGLAADGNGIEFTDNTVPGGNPTTVTALNGSFAVSDLGLPGSSTGATLTGEDRATVAVDSAFSHLIALRDALLANDERGITLATERLEADLSRQTRARAEVGVRARRIADANFREEDLRIQDMALRSEVQDLDYTEAALRFSTLQQQLQAGLLTASRVGSISLLDFLR